MNHSCPSYDYTGQCEHTYSSPGNSENNGGISETEMIPGVSSPKENEEKVLEIIYKNGQHYIKSERWDNLGDDEVPITMGAIIDLHKQIRRYINDWRNENKKNDL